MQYQRHIRKSKVEDQRDVIVKRKVISLVEKENLRSVEVEIVRYC